MQRVNNVPASHIVLLELEVSKRPLCKVAVQHLLTSSGRYGSLEIGLS